MAKRHISIPISFLLCVFLLFGCGNTTESEPQEETPLPDVTVETTIPSAEGYDILGGSWSVGGIYYKNQFVDIHSNEALEDLYDSTSLIFSEDGSFTYINVALFHEGTYEKREPDASGNTVFYLKTESVFTYEMVNDELVEKPSTSDSHTSYIITLAPGTTNTLSMSELDPITGKTKAGEDPVVYVKDSSPAPSEDESLRVDELLQGTWEFYQDEIGFGEILVFDNGRLHYTSYVDGARDNDSNSSGTYRISGGQIITTLNNYDCYFDYELSGNTLNVTQYIEAGYDAGETRVYHQTEKGSWDGTAADVAPSAPASTPKPSSTPKPTHTPSPSATIGEKNALDTALSYLRAIPFSYEGLIDQLEYEGFSYSESKYGADHCGADWYEQAELCAKSYLDSMAFSYEGLIDQLEYEGFSYSEAKHGADNCGADWYAQAVLCAESYLDIFSFSRSELIDQLEYEGFSYEQASYAADIYY